MALRMTLDGRYVCHLDSHNVDSSNLSLGLHQIIIDREMELTNHRLLHRHGTAFMNGER